MVAFDIPHIDETAALEGLDWETVLELRERRPGRGRLAAELVAGVGPPPCDNCYWRRLCARELMACSAFTYYVQEGKIRRPRPPSRQRYNALFRERLQGRLCRWAVGPLEKTGQRAYPVWCSGSACGHPAFETTLRSAPRSQPGQRR